VTDLPRPTPVEKLFTLVLLIIRVLDTRSMYGPFPRPLAQAIRARIQAISRLFRRVAEQVAAGTYVPRRLSSPRRSPTITRPRRPGPLPVEAGWLRKLLPDVAPNLAGNLYALLTDPATVAVIEAAPGPLIRPLRSFCHMLALDPPPVLAIPRRPRPPPAPAQPAPAGKRRPCRPAHPSPPPRRTRRRRRHRRSPRTPAARRCRVPPERRGRRAPIVLLIQNENRRPSG
jgi:hypothetical protein